MRLIVTFFFVVIITACSVKDTCELDCDAKRSDKYVLLTVSNDANERSTKYNLEDALEQAKILLSEKTSVAIELEAGKYYLDSPLILDQQYSGTQQAPFIIRSAVPGSVTLSAGEPLELDWQKHDEQVYKTKLSTDDFDSLYINGEQQIRARYPNFDSSVSVFNGYSADSIDRKRIMHWQDPQGGFVHSLHESRWGGMHHEIVGKDLSGELILEGGFQNNRRSEMHEKYRYVENVYEELDASGEWFYNQDEETLYFYPPEDLDLNKANVVVSRLAHLIEVRGKKDKPVRNIRIEGVEFTQTRQTFMQVSEPLLRSDWAVYRGGAILLEHSEYIQIANNDFQSLGGNAIFVSNYNRQVEISGNQIHDIGASAIAFVGNPDAVRSPSFEYKEFVELDQIDFEPGPKTDNYPSNSRVFDNLIYDIGKVEKQVAGVQISMASEITVSHNSIYRVPRAGINVSEGTWGGHIIEYNDVFDTVLETGDHGAFNSWGRDRFWHPDRAEMDRIAQVYPDMWKLDAINPTVIRNNRFQCDHGWDIDLDDGSSNYEIYNNLMLNGGLKLREGFKRIATNNIILNNSFHPHVWFNNSQDVFRHNLVLASHKPILNEHWGDEINHNFFATQDGLDKAQALGLDLQSVVFETNFVDPKNGDYSIPSDNAAIEGGFKNFTMNKFGVKSQRLKALAERPEFPELFIEEEGEAGKSLELFGAEFKNIETLGEQSALGAAYMEGAMIIAVTSGSVAAREGLQARDLILKVQDLTFGGEDEIRNIHDFMNSYQSRKWRGVLDVVILRNQQEKNFTLDLLE